MRAIRLFALLVLIATLAIGLVSCGGNGSDTAAGTGQLRLVVSWPASRDMPPATRSLKILVKTLVKNSEGEKVEDATVGEKIVVRPEGQSSSEATVDDLPSVEVRVRVMAFASADGTGSPIASGQKDAVVTENGTTNLSITLQADVASLVAQPASITVAAGGNATLTTTARGFNNAPITIDSGRWTYTSANPAVATVTKHSAPNGNIADVHGVAAGTTSIEVKDSQTGVVLQVSVTVGGEDRCPYFHMTAPGDQSTTRNFSGTNVHYDFGGGAIGGDDVLSLTAFGGTVTADSRLFYTVSTAETIAHRAPINVPFIWEGDFTVEAGSALVSITVNGVTRSETVTSSKHVVLDFSVPVHNGDVVKVTFNASATSPDPTKNVNPSGSLHIDEPPGVSIFADTCAD